MKPMQSKASFIKPRVVIVGASFSGLGTFRYLRKDADITIIEPRDFFEYSPGILHVLTGSKSYSSILSPLHDITKGAETVRGWFAGVSPEEKSVYVISYEAPDQIIKINYDALILTTGSAYEYPIKTSKGSLSRDERIRDIEEYKATLDRCESVAVLGGGLVGVEMAAELAHRMPDKKVTLVSRDRLLRTLPAAAGRLAQRWLERRGVRLLLGQPVIRQSKTSAGDGDRGAREVCVLANGEEVSADLIINCTNIPTKILPPIDTSASSDAILTASQDAPEGSRVLTTNEEGFTAVTRVTLPGSLPKAEGDAGGNSSGATVLVAPSPVSVVSATALKGGMQIISFPIELPLLSTSSQKEQRPSSEVVWPFDREGKVTVDRHLRAAAHLDAGIFAAGDVTRMCSCPFPCAACGDGRGGRVGKGPSGSARGLFDRMEIEGLRTGLRTAHLAEAQAELCSRNVLAYLRSGCSTSAGPLQRYPNDLFLTPSQPLLACVSLGPLHAILIFNNIVLGGVILSTVAALAKFIIERSKIADIRNSPAGNLFWAFSHVLVNAVHLLTTWIDRILDSPLIRSLRGLLARLFFGGIRVANGLGDKTSPPSYKLN